MTEILSSAPKLESGKDVILYLSARVSRVSCDMTVLNEDVPPPNERCTSRALYFPYCDLCGIGFCVFERPKPWALMF